ncbi:hypothetical protein SDC9_110516 [bioreactor metagenome]|uniref:Uncharacterized protein n=1 Tax=bioreactor metagenome TaxID=1076179 RepID=A0A645BDW4_9ZZZZ
MANARENGELHAVLGLQRNFTDIYFSFEHCGNNGFRLIASLGWMQHEYILAGQLLSGISGFFHHAFIHMQNRPGKIEDGEQIVDRIEKMMKVLVGLNDFPLKHIFLNGFCEQIDEHSQERNLVLVPFALLLAGVKSDKPHKLAADEYGQHEDGLDLLGDQRRPDLAGPDIFHMRQEGKSLAQRVHEL